MIQDHVKGERRLGLTGTDPGIVTTATIALVSPQQQIDKIQKYATEQQPVEPTISTSTKAPASHSSTERQQPTQQSQDPSSKPVTAAVLNLTSSVLSDRVFSTVHRQQREWRKKKEIETTDKKRAKQARTREIRSKRFYSKFGSRVRRKAVATDNTNKKQRSSVLHFYGSWTGRNSRIKGHSRQGSQQKMQQRMNCPENDHVLVIDESNTTKTCGSCLHRVELQWQRQEDGTFRRCKGAVNCGNPRCPLRLDSNQTTKGRDSSGANNIALSGLSMLMSQDSKPLPVFQRGAYTTAYQLAEPFEPTNIIGASTGH